MVFDSRQGDLNLFNTLNGGNISVKNGEPLMDQGLETAVYITLEGGRGKWFANEYLLEARQIKSRFATFRQGRVLTSGVIATSENLIYQDLQWLLDEKVADKIEKIAMRIMARNRVEILINIVIGKRTLQLSPFQLNWNMQMSNPVSGLR